MKELDLLIEKALFENDIFSFSDAPYWCITKNVCPPLVSFSEDKEFTRIVISHWPNGVSRPSCRILTFCTSLINQTEIDEACRFIEDNLKK